MNIALFFLIAAIAAFGIAIIYTTLKLSEE
jgi:hypothetical protein